MKALATTDSSLPLLQPLEIGDLHLETVEHAEDVFDRRFQLASGLGQIDLTPDLLEQRQPDDVGQALDLGRDCRLGQIELVGGLGEALQARDGLGHLKLTQTDVTGEIQHVIDHSDSLDRRS